MITNKKSTKVGFNIFVNEACPNVDYKYGLYDSVEEAYAQLGEDGDDVIALGLTVGIKTESGVVEYWWKNGLGLKDLVPKGTDLTDIEQTIEEDERVIAEALHDLNNRIDTNETQILDLLQKMDAKLDNINERLTYQEEEQEQDEWEEV